MLVEFQWLLLSATLAIFQLYHGENKLIFQWDDGEICFALDQPVYMECYSPRIDMLQHSDIILSPSPPVFAHFLP
jgi:hypothetical protein